MTDRKMALSQSEIESLFTQHSQSLSTYQEKVVSKTGQSSMSETIDSLSSLLEKKMTLSDPTTFSFPFHEFVAHVGIPFANARSEITGGGKGVFVLGLPIDVATKFSAMLLGSDGSDNDEFDDLHKNALSEIFSQISNTFVRSFSETIGRTLECSPFEIDVIPEPEPQPDLGWLAVLEFPISIEGVVDGLIFLGISLDLCLAIANPTETSEPSPKPLSNSATDPAPQKQDEAQPLQQPKTTTMPNDVRMPSFSDFDEPKSRGGENPRSIAILKDVELVVRAELGHTSKKIREILELAPGSIVELDKLAGEPIDIFVNNKKIAVGEVVVIDEKFGIRVTDVIDPVERVKTFG